MAQEVRKFEFGTDGIQEMINYFEHLAKNDYKSMLDPVVDTLANEAKQMIDASLDGQYLDDNSRGNVSVQKMKTKTKVVHSGKQVAFLEFGTGYVGMNDPHPLAPENSWKYYIDTIYKKEVYGVPGWFYNGRFKVGIPAGRNVYNAAKRVRKDIPKVAKEMIKF